MIRLSLAVRRGLAGDDVDVDWGADLGMQADPDLVRTEGLDRVANLDPAPVELGTARLTDRRRDVGGPDRAEQPAAAARAPPHPHVQPLELRGDDLGVLEAADLPGRPGPLDQVDLLLRAAGPRHREAARDQVVAAVAGGHVHHVTGCPEAAHLLGEDELHRCATHLPDPSQRAVLVYGSSAISRAFLIAVATSRWWRVQLPVTRRARIFPRSEMYLRSRPVSL